MKKIVLIATVLLAFSCQNQAQTNKKNMETKSSANAETIYQFKIKDLYGKEFDFATLKGKKILIVNTASECGLTPQYKDLEAIYKKYNSNNFVIVGFPANNFGGQEPGTNAEVATFCKTKFGVSFQMFEKISVKGTDAYTFKTTNTKRKL